MRQIAKPTNDDTVNIDVSWNFYVTIDKNKRCAFCIVAPIIKIKNIIFKLKKNMYDPFVFCVFGEVF